jgi:Mn2+/Fe2+ NRAMP family transporter
VVLGACVALVPNVPVVELLIGIQALNGVLLPVILVFILLLINDRMLVPEKLRNTVVYNILGWASVALVGGAAALLVLNQALSLFGLGFFS